MEVGNADCSDLDENSSTIPPKSSLTPEEASLKAIEIQRKIREMMKIKEKETEIRSERERIEQGKILQKQRELLMQHKSRQIIEEAIKGKKELMEERERQLNLLKQEYKERFGTEYSEVTLEPTKELSEVEKKKKIATLLGNIRTEYMNQPEVIKTCLKTLKIYFKNIVDNPLVDKYKTIKRDNLAFKSKVSIVQGVHELLDIVGFDFTEEKYQIVGKPQYYLLSSAIKYIDFILGQL